MIISPIKITYKINKKYSHKKECKAENNRTIETKKIIPTNLMGVYTFSFKAKKTKNQERELRQSLYKKLIKSGCKDKEASKILYDESVFKRFQELIAKNEKSTFNPPLNEKDLLTFAVENYSDKNISRYIKLSTSPKNEANPFPRRLNRKEILTALENQFSDEQIKRFIKLKGDKENENTYLSRNLTPSEATHVVSNNLSDNQAQVYIKMRDLEHNSLHYSTMRNLLDSEKDCQKVLIITSEENGFSRQLDDYSAMLATVYDFSKEEIERQIELEDKQPEKLTQDEVADIVQADFDDDQVEKYITQRQKLEAQLKSNSEFWAKRQAKVCAFDIVKYDLDELQTHYYLKLQEVINNPKAIEIIKNPEALERLEELYAFQKEDKDEDYFSPREILSILDNKFDNDQAILYREIHHTNSRESIALAFARDKKTVERYKNLINENNYFSRPLTSKEATNIIIHKIPDEKIEEFINLSDKQIELQHITVLLEFTDYKNTQNINILSLNQKRNFIKKLVEQSSFLMYTQIPKDVYPIVPKNANDFSKLLSKLAKQIGINSKPLPNTEKQECLNSINSLAENLSEVDLTKTKIVLDYPQERFIEDISNLTNNLDEEEKNRITEQFKFSIKERKLIGYPTPNNKIKTPIEEEINQLVKKYTQKNNAKVVNGTSIEKDINTILEYLPELKSIIGRKQHRGHSLTLDIHSLQVLKNITLSEEYEQLSDKDKRVLSISALLHDITKEECKKDKKHPIESAFEAYYIIQKLNLSEYEQIQIYELIKTHDWLEKINKSDDFEESIKDYAFTMRHSNIFELAKIFCKADIKAVRTDKNLFYHFADVFDEISQEIETKIQKLQETQIILPQTIIPKASEIKDGETKTADNVTNTVLYMNKLDNDLSQYGFEKGTTKENFRALVHALDEKTQLDIFSTFSAIDSEALLSASYISPENYSVFRKQGLILDVNYNDIHAGYHSDFGSGFKKTINELKEKYLFPSDEERNYYRKKTIYRQYISDLIKQKIGLTDKEYLGFLKEIQDCKSFTDLKNINEDYANLIKEALDEMEPNQRTYKRKYNEMLVTRPKIQGIFSYSQPYEKIPLFLRQYAQENNLPIIMFDK